MKTKYFPRKITSSNEGVAGVLVSVLLVGLMISAITYLQAVQVPQWMEEKEAEHMDKVATQFAEFKYTIDTLSTLEKENSAISVPITLGSKELPFLPSERSYGTLEIKKDDFKIEFTDNNAETETYQIGAVKYKSDNSYYLNQEITYEAGGIILNQDEGEIITVKPSIFFDTPSEITFELVEIEQINGKTHTSGYGTYPIQIRYKETETMDIINTKKITIYNTHLEAWKKYFEKLFDGYNNVEPIQYTTNNDGIIITFKDIAKPPIIQIKLIKMNMQIAPGWIE